MEGPRAARADRFAGRHSRRRCRVCAVVAAALLAAAHAISECTAVDATAESPSRPQSVAREADADSSTRLSPSAPILNEHRPSADSLLFTADARAKNYPADRSAVWHDPNLTRAGGHQPIGRGIAAMGSAPRIFYDDKFDVDSLRVHLPANDFADSGPGTLKPSVSGLDVDSDRSVAGGRLQLTAADDERGRLLIETRLSWMFEYLQTDAARTAFFMPGQKGIFAVQGLSYGSNWALVGVGLRFELVGGWIAYAGYDAQLNSQQLFHIGSGGVAYAW